MPPRLMPTILRQSGLSGQLNFINVVGCPPCNELVVCLGARYQGAASAWVTPLTDSRNTGSPSGRCRATLPAVWPHRRLRRIVI